MIALPGARIGNGRWVKLEVLDAQRRLVREMLGPKNLITNIGLDRIGENAAVGQYCLVGTGTTAPANADTGLVAQAASTSNVVAQTVSNAGAPNYETIATLTYEFALGAVSGNMAEIGVGWGTEGAALFSRARILDSGGSPTTIAVSSAEILRATYELTHFPTLTDATGVVSISGVDYDYISRRSNVGSPVASAQVLTPWMQGPIFGAASYDGPIGAITGGPAGAGDALSNLSLAAYTPGSYARAYSIFAGITQSNLVGGIRSIAFDLQAMGQHQIEFDPPIPKTLGQELTLTFSQSWGRH